MNTPHKSSDFSWLSTEEAEYGDPSFAQSLASKLQDLSSGNIGPGARLHYNNVAIAYTHLYGFDMEGVGANAALVTRSGNQGSIAELRIPANAGLLRKAWNIVVGPELTWSADATTTDFDSEAQAVTSRNSLHYYWKHDSVGAICKAIAFEAMAFGESAMHAPWDTTLGKPIGVEPTPDGGQRIAMSGDVRYSRISTWDILRDPTATSFSALKWIVVREWHDKFDMRAICDTDEQRQACMSSQVQIPGQPWLPFRATYNQATDRIPVYYLYAQRTPSLPGGRETVFLNNGVVLKDGPMDEAYVDLPGCIGPVAPMRVGEYGGTPWPSSKWTGTLGAEQAADALFRDLLTNATAVSGSIISAEESAMDAAMSMAVQGGGPQVVPRPNGSKAPEVLQLQAAHPEHFKLISTLRNECQQIMGIDNITAGAADVSKTLSGAAMALMTSTSVQNNSQEQFVYSQFCEAVGNLTIRHIQKHMTVPKRIALAGNARSGLVGAETVSGDQIRGIQRVFCTIGAAMQQTDAGKYEIATTAVKEGWVKTPEQLQTVLDTGRLDALTEDLSNKLLVVKQENERIGRGEVPPVMWTDDHLFHIKGHATVMDNIAARDVEAVVTAQQAHVDSHIRALRETDPVLLQATGQQSLAPAGMPGAASGTPPPGPGASSGTGPPGEPPAPPKPPQEAAQEAGPSLPKNPATGAKAGAVAGAPSPALAISPN